MFWNYRPRAWSQHRPLYTAPIETNLPLVEFERGIDLDFYPKTWTSFRYGVAIVGRTESKKKRIKNENGTKANITSFNQNAGAEMHFLVDRCRLVLCSPKMNCCSMYSKLNAIRSERSSYHMVWGRVLNFCWVCSSLMKSPKTAATRVFPAFL